MAGDHKCPVCQSTFTRPQHVARHMRSHTGDRPYKCQHCGDQFARSDLLSRHINKCHASEKPPTTTAPSRRKGFAAASRATTSKQACDQCVTSSLPCDGANPCSKCVQRKCRCTYVKFHRQTAPAGPGHPVPPTLPPAGIGRHSISLGAPRLPDEFLLAPPPGTMNLSSMYAPTHQYGLPPSVPVYSHDYSLPPLASALAPSQSPMPPVLQAQHRDVMENPDAMARYRAQAELLSRAGVMPNGNLTLAQPAPSADNSAALPGLYAAAAGGQDGHYDRYTLPPPAQWDAQRHYSQKDFEEPYGPRSQSHPTAVHSYSAAGAAGGEPSLQTHPPTAASSSYQASSAAGPSYQHGALPPATSLYPPAQTQHHHSRSDDMSGSEAEFGSDAGSTSTGPTSHSMPNSANSSAVHLPLPGFNNLRTRAEMGGKEYDQRYEAQSTGSHEGEGGFSSAFGLMSLDDPNVLAGLSSDGQPFFSGLPFSPGNTSNGLSLATPTQDLIAQFKSAGGREGMDSKEMRDFWKMYLKTPLTGPNSGGGIMFPLQTPTGPGAQLGQGMAGGGRPSPTRRHSRVASLPSMKTPPLFAEQRLGSYGRPSTGDASQESHAGAYQGQQQQQQQQQGYNSTVRTTLHDAEDLKSYEQAVLARKAPMNLNLNPKRKGSMASAQAGPSSSSNPAAAGKSKSMSPVVPPAAFAHVPSTSLPGSSKIAELLNRPASSSSAGTTASSGSGVSGPSETSTANTSLSQASSSLAHAFGGEQAHSDNQGQGQGAAADAAASYMAQQTFRPGFKRLASQTLGPPNAKRALLGPAGWDHDDVDEEDEGLDEDEEDEDRDAMDGRRMTLGSRGGGGGGYGGGEASARTMGVSMSTDAKS